MPEKRAEDMCAEDLVAALRELADRVCDVEHPKGWVCDFSDEAVDLVRAAAGQIERLRADALDA